MKSISTEIKWAAIFILTTFVWMYLEKMLGMYDEHIEWHPMVSNFFAIPAILIYVFALRDKRKNYYSGSITYSQAFISGLILTGILTLFAPITQYIVSSFISPEYFEKMTRHAVDTGKMPLGEAREYFNLKSYLIQTTIFTPIMGIVTSAVVALFVKTKNTKRSSV